MDYYGLIWIYYDGPNVTPFIYTLMYVKEKELIYNCLKSHIHAHVFFFTYERVCVYVNWDMEVSINHRSISINFDLSSINFD